MRKATVSTLLGIIAAVVIGIVVIILLAMLRGSSGNVEQGFVDLFFKLF